jgi:hypothetical protein
LLSRFSFNALSREALKPVTSISRRCRLLLRRLRRGRRGRIGGLLREDGFNAVSTASAMGDNSSLFCFSWFLLDSREA